MKIEDTLTNMGHKDEQYCILYHVNLGYPMLDEGARVELDDTFVRRTIQKQESITFTLQLAVTEI